MSAQTTTGVPAMSRIHVPRIRSGSALLAALVLAAALLPQSAAVRPAAKAATSTGANRVGIVCTTDDSPGGPTFTLTTRTGYISLPDGSTAYMWGYSLGSGAFQHPGPVLCVDQDQVVTIVLKNTFANDDVSIVFPGQENVLANGAPAQPQFDGGGALTSLTNVAPRNNGTVTYQFTASRPGTFLYESGTNPQLQVRMGLFGALIVRPTMGADYAYDWADSQFNAQTEFMALLSEIDPSLNAAVKRGRSFDLDNYHPTYWLINGRAFPDSISDNFASFLPSQPYGALALIHPLDTRVTVPNPDTPDPDDTMANPAYNPLPSLTRYLNVGTDDFPFHPHGNNGRIIGRDGWPLEGPGGVDLSFEKFSVNIGPGQTWDSLFSWRDPEAYSPGDPIPVTEPPLTDITTGMFYGGSPYLGYTEQMPPGVQTLNQCGEYYILAHNHALYQITEPGTVTMVGPITYTRVDPPLPNDCPQ